MVSALSLTLVACGGGKSTTAWCVDRQGFPTGQTKGGYKVVSNYLCDTRDIERGTVGYGRYFWYYGGTRDSNSGVVSGGTVTGPSKGKIKSSSGSTLVRGGFGGGGKSGG
jgi:hypothetical protein